MSDDTAPNSAVTCKTCGAEITFRKEQRLPNIMGFKCDKCGRRNVYSPEDAHLARLTERKF